MRVLFTISFLLFSNYAISQNQSDKILEGKIISDNGDVSDLYIINLANNKVALSNKDGFFSLSASVGDTIHINAIRFKSQKIKLTNEDFSASPFLIKVALFMNQLNEVAVFKNKKFDANAMKFTYKDIKIFTPATRKLNTASNPYLNFNLGFTAKLDPIFNALSGRTASLKKLVASEKKDLAIIASQKLFQNDFFIQELHIPKENTSGFLFYIVEDASYVSALENKNKNGAEILIRQLAIQYLTLLSEK